MQKVTKTLDKFALSSVHEKVFNQAVTSARCIDADNQIKNKISELENRVSELKELQEFIKTGNQVYFFEDDASGFSYTDKSGEPYEYKEECLALAVMHDLWEDTDYPRGCGLGEYFEKALNLLTKPKDMDYIEYIKKIRDTACTNWRMCAWWVKLADMKDHLAQTETLTEKLRDKYLAALPYLL